MHQSEEIISRIKQGDEKIIPNIYREYKSEFLSFAASYSLGEEDALDIYQDAMIAFYENAMKGKIETLKSSIKTYIFAIAKYMIYAKLKKRQPTLAFEELPNELIDWETYEDYQQDKQLLIVRKHFNKLGGKCKEILQMIFYEEKSTEEIMGLMGYESKDVVKSQKSRCVKKLKDMINQL